MNVSAGLENNRWREEPKDDVVQIVKAKNVKDIDEVSGALIIGNTFNSIQTFILDGQEKC